MKNEKDILKWFKQNANQSEESPSNELWNRLNDTLEPTSSTSIQPSWWKLATGVAALLLISVIIFNPFSKQDVHLAKNETPTEVLEAESNKSITSEQVYDSLTRAKSRSEDESDSEQSVGYAESNNTNQVAAIEPLEQPTEIEEKTKDQQPLMAIQTKSADEMTEDIVNPEVWDMEGDALSDQTDPEEIVANEEEAIVLTEEDVFDTESMEIAASGARESEPEAMESEFALDEIQSAPSSVKSKKDMRSATTTRQTNSMSGAGTHQSAIDLDWLLGEWQEQRSNETIIENWTKTNDYELIGEGYAITETDTVFYEQLKISSFNGQVILQMQVDQASPPVNFQLVRNDGSVAVFNNYEIEFPNEIVYERFGNNTLNTTFRSAQSNGNINDSNFVGNRNINYLQQRNNISNTEMYRNMRRTTN